ncbi:hypothetical protein RRG08_034191, partial [Elysia crispata]
MSEGENHLYPAALFSQETGQDISGLMIESLATNGRGRQKRRGKEREEATIDYIGA